MRTDVPGRLLALVEEIVARRSAIPRRPSPFPTVPTGARRDADETPEVLARVRTQLRDPHRVERDGRPAWLNAGAPLRTAAVDLPARQAAESSR